MTLLVGSPLTSLQFYAVIGINNVFEWNGNKFFLYSNEGVRYD